MLRYAFLDLASANESCPNGCLSLVQINVHGGDTREWPETVLNPNCLAKRSVLLLATGNELLGDGLRQLLWGYHLLLLVLPGTLTSLKPFF